MRATFSPRPPPPNAALMATGRPCSSAKATTSSASLTGSLVPGTSGAPALVAMCRACDLVAEGDDRLGGGADPGQAGVDDRLREVGVLGEEAVPGVDGVGAGLLGGVEDLVDDQVGVAGRGAAERERLVGDPDVQRVPVGLGVDGHAGQPRVLAGACDADRDLTAVGDQDLLHRRSPFEVGPVGL